MATVQSGSECELCSTGEAEAEAKVTLPITACRSSHPHPWPWDCEGPYRGQDQEGSSRTDCSIVYRGLICPNENEGWMGYVP